MQRYLFPLVLILSFGAISFASGADAGITYSGGDGSTLEKAVIINGATEMTGVKAEYEYLRKHFPGYKFGRQSLLQHNGRVYDLLEFTTDDGKKAVYFDITDFFGKY